MEIGIERGQFSVIRVHPNENAPEGAFIVRITDAETGIRITTMMKTDDGMTFAKGFNTDSDPEVAGVGAKVLHVPTEGEARVHGIGGRDRRADREELEETPAPAE